MSPAGSKRIRPGLCFIIAADLKGPKKPTAGSLQLGFSHYSSPLLRKQDAEAWFASESGTLTKPSLRHCMQALVQAPGQ